jgi:hypothetical protein
MIKVARLTARYQAVNKAYSCGSYGTNSEFEKAIVELYRTILVFYIRAACYFSRSTISRTFRNTIVIDDWKSTLGDIDKAEKNCQDFTTLLGISTILENSDRILNELTRITSADYLAKIRNWLIPEINLDSRSGRLNPRYKSSGRWLLDSQVYKDWNCEGHGLLWIQGASGTGKSSLVSIIIDKIKGLRNVVYFYCTDALEPFSENLNHITVILRALITQLAMSPEDENKVAEEVQLSYDAAGTEGRLRTAEPLDRLKAGLLLTQLINSREQTTIIIDGLDECPHFTELLAILKNIHNSCNNLRLLLSSQYVVPVNHINYFPSINEVVAGGEDSIEDMKSFIRGELEDFSGTRPGQIGEELASDIIETLSKQAEGMFVNIPPDHFQSSADYVQVQMGTALSQPCARFRKRNRRGLNELGTSQR